MIYNILQLTSKVASTRIVQFEDVTLVSCNTHLCGLCKVHIKVELLVRLTVANCRCDSKFRETWA